MNSHPSPLVQHTQGSHLLLTIDAQISCITKERLGRATKSPHMFLLIADAFSHSTGIWDSDLIDAVSKHIIGSGIQAVQYVNNMQLRWSWSDPNT